MRKQTAGASHPAVFDSFILAGRNPAILFVIGAGCLIQENK